MKIIDISIPLSEKTLVWEGDKGIRVLRVAKIEEGSDFNVSRIELGVHAGTHIDAPFHVFENGNTVDQIPFETLIGSVQVIEIPDEISVIDKNCLMKLNFQDGIDRILFKTSNSLYWETNPFSFKRDYVAINSEGAKYLADMDLRLVGVDYFSVSSFDDLKQPHLILLGRGIVLLENIDLRQVVPGIYKLICLPLKIIETDGAPVRAVLISE
jgi:arylformamidase